MTRQSRDLKRLDIVRVDTKTGEVKMLVEERMNTYIETKPIRFLEGEKEFLWWSERDGWGHWYLYGIDGTLKNQVTKGEFVTREHRRRGREDADAVRHGERPRGGRGPLLRAPVPRGPRRQRH